MLGSLLVFPILGRTGSGAQITILTGLEPLKLWLTRDAGPQHQTFLWAPLGVRPPLD